MRAFVCNLQVIKTGEMSMKHKGDLIAQIAQMGKYVKHPFSLRLAQSHGEV